MKKKHVFILVFFSIGLILATYYMINTPIVRQIEPLKYMPSNTLFFIRFNNISDFKSSIDKYYDKKLFSNYPFNKLYGFAKSIDSFANSDNKGLQFFTQTESYLYVTGSGRKTSFLVVIPNNTKLSQSKFNKLVVLSGIQYEAKGNIGDNKIYMITQTDGSQFLISLCENLVLISDSKNTIAQYIVNIKKKKVYESHSFEQSIKSSGKKIDVNIYVSLVGIQKYWNNAIKAKHIRKESLVSDTWFVYDVNINQKGILLNGLAFTDNVDSFNEWLHSISTDPLDSSSLNSAFDSIQNIGFEKQYMLDSLIEYYISVVKKPLKFDNTFYSALFNISMTNQLIYTNIILKKENDKYIGPRIDWRIQLDDSISKGPVLNEAIVNNGSRQIIVSDKTGKIYGISSNGKIDWSLKLDEQVMSNFFIIDYYKNQKSQYLFNTRHWIYLLDIKGKVVDGFPIKLINPATNGLCLADPDNDKNYRIYLSCNNNRVYALSKNGTKIDAWRFNQKVENCTNPILFYKHKKTDYLVIQGKEKVFVVNRRGKSEITIKTQFPMSGNRLWFEDRGKMFRLVTTAPDGTIWSIFKNGKVDSIKVGMYGVNHNFALNDVDNDRVNEYIFIEANKLDVYRQDRSTSFFYTSTSDLASNLQYYGLDADFRLSVVNKIENSLYFFTSDGTIYNGFPVNGNSQQIVVKNYNRGYQLIVGSNDNFLYNYYFE